MNAENSERAGNIRGDGDSDTKNGEDLCLLSIEPCESLRNLSSEIEKNTSLPLEKIDQALSNDEFLDIDDIDDFLRPAWAWTASLASEQPQLQGGAAQSPVEQSPSSRMPNPTLPTDDNPMAATATPEIWGSPKRKADTVALDEGGRVGIHGKAISTSTLTCLIILQNTHLNFLITPESMTGSISRSLNKSSELAMGGTITQTSCRLH